MNPKRISELNNLETSHDRDILPIVNQGETKRQTKANFLKEVWAAITSHLGSRDNPHAVTKAQIGLETTSDLPEGENKYHTKARVITALQNEPVSMFENDEGYLKEVAWNEVENKPTSFPPSAHTHPTNQIEGLSTALAGKEDTFTKKSAFNKDFGATEDTVARGDHNHDTRYVLDAEKGVANGVATLDSEGKVLASQIPPLAITDVFIVETIEERNDLTVQTGDVAKVTSENRTYIYDGTNWYLLADNDNVETDPVFNASPAKSITNQNITDWKAAFGWGNHALAGYLKSFTEADPTVPSYVKAIEEADIAEWNSAHSKEHTHENKAVLDATTASYTTVEKNKLEGIQAQAQKNVQSDWAETDEESDSYIANKPEIPTKTSDLENDADFISEAPSDGKQYARKDEGWSEVEGGGGGDSSGWIALEQSVIIPESWTTFNKPPEFGVNHITFKDSSSSAGGLLAHLYNLVFFEYYASPEHPYSLSFWLDGYNINSVGLFRAGFTGSSSQEGNILGFQLQDGNLYGVYKYFSEVERVLLIESFGQYFTFELEVFNDITNKIASFAVNGEVLGTITKEGGLNVSVATGVGFQLWDTPDFSQVQYNVGHIKLKQKLF